MKPVSLLDNQSAYVKLVTAKRDRGYKVAIVERFQEAGGELLAELIGSRNTLVVTTPSVARLHTDRVVAGLRHSGCSPRMLVLNCDETNKTFEQVNVVCRAALEMKLDRRGLLIAVGGGVCTDIVSLSASLIRRGVAHVRVPTTLTGQIDAAIGIKGAINFEGKKSFLGCFCAPQFVIVDPAFLRTLPRRHLGCGMAEIIKMAIVRDEALFASLEQFGVRLLEAQFAEPFEVARHTIWRSIELMLEELEPNIYEDQTYKRLVDFGHFFSPLLESRSEFKLLHGEAVAIDMALTAAIAAQQGILARKSRDRIVDLLQHCGLPIYSDLLNEALCRSATEEAIRHRAGAVNMVVPTSLGQAAFLERPTDLSTRAIRQALAWLAKRSLKSSVPKSRGTKRKIARTSSVSQTWPDLPPYLPAFPSSIGHSTSPTP